MAQQVTPTIGSITFFFHIVVLALRYASVRMRKFIVRARIWKDETLAVKAQRFIQ
jgi:hypothetical protein